MATVSDYASPPPFSRSSSLSLSRSPDTASPIYPDRAIRPLPKSRLKSKLSPEQQNAIIYPPDPPPISPTLNSGAVSHDELQQSVTKFIGTNGDGNCVTHGDYLHDHRSADGFVRGESGYSHHTGEQVDTHSQHCTCGGDGDDSGEEEVEFDHPDYRYASPMAAAAAGLGPGGREPDSVVTRRLMEAARISSKPPPPGSTASSADGYESFENTSNKKKRKIPLNPNASSVHQTQAQLSAEMASMGISGGSVDGAADDVNGGDGAVAVQQQGQPLSQSAGTGISGAGRGRYGRQSVRGEHALRRPLGSSNINSHLVNGYTARPPARSGSEVKGAGGSAADSGIENSSNDGIISQAIKTAAEQGPLTPHKGQENGSLLQSVSASSTPTNTKTQFTFTVESESANKMLDQPTMFHTPTPSTQRSVYTGHGGATGGPPGGGGGKGMSTQGTQTTPSLRNGHVGQPPQPGQQPIGNNGAGTLPAPSAPPAPNGQQQQPAPAAQPKPPKPRRRPSKEFALAARQRRMQQEYTNYHHRPSKEKDNLYICAFCEYEDIFGVPPVALIRQYEIKDRRERRKAAEKRRLLEKAKAKGRKGKKGNKKGANTNNNNLPAAPVNNGVGAAGGAGNGGYDPNERLDMDMPPDVEGEEYYDDEEEEEYAEDDREYEPVPGGGGGYAAGADPAGGYYNPAPPGQRAGG